MRDSFDVVVVGAGAAGCVVAARLAASCDATVLLLEAGPDARGQMPLSMLDGWTIDREPFDWGYRSEGPKPMPVRRKRVVGGTSWLTRFALRGGPADYDGWASHGVNGWSWQDVLPAFVALENDLDLGERPWHGATGPMPISRQLDIPFTDVGQATLDAAVAAGFAWVEDHNDPGAVGVGRMPMNVVDARRVTTAEAYLPLGATPASLTIRGDALVDRIEFAGRRAVGVALADHTRVEAAHVILCAGVYGSPAILLRSGIGPEGTLVHLPGVGANLADHPAVSIEGGGVPTERTRPVLHGVATWHSTERDRQDTPDLMLWISDPEDEPPVFGLTIVLLRPRSRGSVRLRSADPNDAPAIELPNLQHPDDVTRLAEGYGRALDVIGQPALSRYRKGVEPVAAADVQAWIRAEAYSLPHTVGTCAMGSVVDADGSLLGVDGISIVDASVFPDVPSGFTHIPTVMLAERLASRIASLL